MQPFVCMGETRRKKWPPIEEEREEAVTDDLRQEVRDKLRVNKERNKLRGAKKKDSPGRLIGNYADLADAIDGDPNEMRRMFGGVRPDTKVEKLRDRSRYVRRIRLVLDLAPVVTREIKASREEAHRDLDELPDDVFEIFRDALKERLHRKAT